MHQGGELVPFFQGHVLLGPVVDGPDAEEELAEEMAVKGSEGGAFDDDGVAAPLNVCSQKWFQLCREIGLVLFRQLAEPKQ